MQLVPRDATARSKPTESTSQKSYHHVAASQSPVSPLVKQMTTEPQPTTVKLELTGHTIGYFNTPSVLCTNYSNIDELFKGSSRPK